VIVLGQIQGPNPSFKALIAWAFSSGHEFFQSFAQVRNGFFEATLFFEVGCKHTFENSFNYDGAGVVFST
jgi:hypothetical protein